MVKPTGFVSGAACASAGAAGGLAGAFLAQRIEGPELSRLFALFLLVVSIQMIVSRPRAREAEIPVPGGPS